MCALAHQNLVKNCVLCHVFDHVDVNDENSCFKIEPAVDISLNPYHLFLPFHSEIFYPAAGKTIIISGNKINSNKLKINLVSLDAEFSGE